MTVRKRNKAESQNRILKAGLSIFSEYGYDAATTKMIAARAGLNESLIQRYFKSKAGLLAAVNKLSAQAMLSQKPYPPQANPESEIFQFFKSRMELDEENLAFVRVVISRILIDEQLREELRQQMPPPKELFLKTRFEDFKNKGLLSKDVDVKVLVDIIMSQSFVVGFLERIMFNKSRRECLAQFRVLSHTLAIGISPRPI